MERVGEFAPETRDAARSLYRAVGPAAQTTVSETAKAMGFDREEYRSRVTSDVVATARDTIFASLLAVTVGTAEEFEAWRGDHPDFEVALAGSENVDNVVWHAAPFASVVVAATYQHEREAAVATLRRQAWGRVYRDAVTV